MNNIVTPFTLNNAEVKGRVVRLDKPLDLILTQHKYSEVVAQILGELLVVASLIGSQFKDEMILTIQLQFKDKLQYIVADYQYPGFIRGYAKCNQLLDDETYSNIIQNSLIVVTIDRENSHRYQGIVEIKGDTISQAIEEYFYQSEQIKTLLKLKIGKIIYPGKQESWHGGGVLIQKLPLKEDEDSWNEAKLYFSTIRDDELLDPNFSINEFLYSVYNEMEVKAYDPIAIEHKCRCSRERMEQVLESLGFDEVVAMLIDNKISVDCQFCNQVTDFTCDAINKIFKQDEHILREDNE